MLQAGEADAMVEQYRRGLDEGKPQATNVLGLIGNKYTVDWTRYHDVDWSEEVRSGVKPALAQGPRGARHQLSRRLHAASAGAEDHRRPAPHGRRPADARLGLCRDARLRQPARGRLRDPPDGPGQRPRHVLPSPRRRPRPEYRRHLHPAQAPEARAAALPCHRFAAVGRGGARLRVRLFDHRPQLPGDLGRPVRRLRQWRAGHHRPVHLLGRGEVGPLLRPGAVPAARLRGAGAGAFIGAPRALPAALRREQHAGLRAVHAGADVPHAAPADAALVPQAADRDDAEEPAAAQAVGVGARRADAGLVPVRARRDRRPRARGRHPRRVLFRQGLFRPARGAPCGRSPQRRDRAHRAAVPVPGRGLRGGAGALPERCARSSGARKSRRTRAPGTRSAIACRMRSRATRYCCTRAAGRPPRRPPASRSCTRTSSTGWSPQRSRPRRRKNQRARPRRLRATGSTRKKS